MKHAILVLAYGNLSVLQKCMEILDDDRFDFYIHIDRKSTDDGRWLSGICKHSSVFFTERIPVYWGHHSMVEAIFLLLRHVLQNGDGYDYHHLISGVDMPLKTPEEINSFFEGAPVGSEFATTRGESGMHDWRMKYRYPFLKKYIRTNSAFLNNIQKALYSRILRFPRKKGTHIIRNRNWDVYMGDVWWSVTDRFARVLSGMEKELIPFWEDAYVSDETLAQTVIMNHPEFRVRKSNFSTRLIDWNRGRPYTWKAEDFEECMESTALFVRKLDISDPCLTEMIYDAVMKRKQESIINNRADKPESGGNNYV